MSTALARAGVGLTVGDVLLLELPHVPEEHREWILWEFTGYPAFWQLSETEPHPVHVLRRQLADFRNGIPTRATSQSAVKDL